jgi:hypothetical protein
MKKRLKSIFLSFLSIFLSQPVIAFPKIQIDEEKDLEIIQMVQVFNTTTLL